MLIDFFHKMLLPSSDEGTNKMKLLMLLLQDFK